MPLYEIRKYPDDFCAWHSSYRNMGFLAHWHDEIELIYVRCGKTVITVDQVEYSLEAGDVLICGSGCVHYCNFPCENILEFIVADTALLFENRNARYLNTHHIPHQALRDAKLDAYTQAFFEKFASELQTRGPHYREITESLLRVYWFSLHRILSQPSPAFQFAPIAPVRQILSYIREHLSEPLSLSSVAEHFNVSKYHFSRSFKRYTGMNFTVYRNVQRLEKAISQIRDTQLSVSEIAFCCGFQDIRTLNRVFRQYTGHTPLDFRRDLHLEVHILRYPHRLPSEDKVVVENNSPVVLLS